MASNVGNQTTSNQGRIQKDSDVDGNNGAQTAASTSAREKRRRQNVGSWFV
ncbi:MAG: hypothetical protein IPN15_17865 [Saprospiraceae bacterium]|nr:hypothetical protein [Candidatus Vicinibacter affinis]